MATGRKSDQDSKGEIATGMSDGGKAEVGKAGSKASKSGQGGHGADPAKLSKGMSEAGSGAAPGAKGSQRKK